MASSAPNSPLFIPQDIINTIVDELHRQHDTSTLSTCARTAHAFRDPCQRHLFHTLSLSNAAPDANQCLLAVLRASVRLQSYPRHFHLRLISLYGTVRAEGALPDILQLLPQLRTFSLAHGITSGLLHFGSISHALKASIFGLLQGEHLGRVDLAHLQEFPIYFLSRCPQLEALTLRDVNPFHIDMWFEPDPELVPAHAHGEPLPGNELRELELRMECNPSWSFVHAQTFGHIRTTVNLERLTKIAIGHLAGDEEVEECWRILEASRILEELEVTLDLSSASRPPQALSFDIPSLSTLSIVIHNGAHTATPAAQRWHTLSWLHSTLSAVSYTSSVRKFTLRLTEQGVADLGREDDLMIWRGVDAVLAGRRFPELGMVRVVFDSGAAAQREASAPGDTEVFLARRVPRLVGKGVLEVVWGKRIYPREGKA